MSAPSALTALVAMTRGPRAIMPSSILITAFVHLVAIAIVATSRAGGEVSLDATRKQAGGPFSSVGGWLCEGNSVIASIGDQPNYAPMRHMFVVGSSAAALVAALTRFTFLLRKHQQQKLDSADAVVTFSDEVHFRQQKAMFIVCAALFRNLVTYSALTASLPIDTCAFTDASTLEAAGGYAAVRLFRPVRLVHASTLMPLYLVALPVGAAQYTAGMLIGLLLILGQYFLLFITHLPALFWFIVVVEILALIGAVNQGVKFATKLRRTGRASAAFLAIIANSVPILIFLSVFGHIDLRVEASLWPVVDAAIPVLSLYHAVAIEDAISDEAMDRRLKDIENQRSSADAKNSAKRQFMRYIFHELRVPLNAITLGLEDLHGTADEAVEAILANPDAPISSSSGAVSGTSHSSTYARSSAKKRAASRASFEGLIQHVNSSSSSGGAIAAQVGSKAASPMNHNKSWAQEIRRPAMVRPLDPLPSGGAQVEGSSSADVDPQRVSASSENAQSIAEDDGTSPSNGGSSTSAANVGPSDLLGSIPSPRNALLPAVKSFSRTGANEHRYDDASAEKAGIAGAHTSIALNFGSTASLSTGTSKNSSVSLANSKPPSGSVLAITIPTLNSQTQTTFEPANRTLTHTHATPVHTPQLGHLITTFGDATGHALPVMTLSPRGSAANATVEKLQDSLDSIRDTIEILMGNATAMGKLLDDFLSLEKIEEGKFEIEPVDFDVRLMIDEAVRMFAAPLAAKELTLKVDVSSAVPDEIKGDVYKLRQVLCNYISNAIKFSPAGGKILLRVSLRTDITVPQVAESLNGETSGNSVSISMPGGHNTAGGGGDSHGSMGRYSNHGSTDSYGTPNVNGAHGGSGSRSGLSPLRRLGGALHSAMGVLGMSRLQRVASAPSPRADGQERHTPPPLQPISSTAVAGRMLQVRFAVTDEGVGISEDDHTKLFKPFNQIKAGALQKGNGTGLGLSICKRIIELSGGRVGVRSRIGKGSTFHFQVPVCSIDDIMGSAFAPLPQVARLATAWTGPSPRGIMYQPASQWPAGSLSPASPASLAGAEVDPASAPAPAAGSDVNNSGTSGAAAGSPPQRMVSSGSSSGGIDDDIGYSVGVGDTADGESEAHDASGRQLHSSNNASPDNAGPARPAVGVATTANGSPVPAAALRPPLAPASTAAVSRNPSAGVMAALVPTQYSAVSASDIASSVIYAPSAAGSSDDNIPGGGSPVHPLPHHAPVIANMPHPDLRLSLRSTISFGPQTSLDTGRLGGRQMDGTLNKAAAAEVAALTASLLRQSASSSSSSAHGPKEPLAPPKLLTHAVVIDDVESNRMFFGRSLKRRGVHTIHYAEDGQQALALLDSLPPNQVAAIQCWFTDKEMPVCDGHECAKHLRARGITAPIFGVTGNALDEDRRLFIAAGVNDVITKPVKIADVEVALSKMSLKLAEQKAAPPRMAHR